MEITELQEFFNTHLKGAIHIGAHHGQEKEWYTKNNISPIIWIDANIEYYDILKKNVGDDMIIISGVGNEDKICDFNLSNNGQSSSFLELGTHIQKYPDVFYVDKVKVEMKRMKTLINENNIIIDDFNFLNLDVQGFELQVIKGFDDLISKFDYIYSEVNTNFLYKNCSLINEIDEYLGMYNFKRVKTLITQSEWGDAFYIKK